MGTMQKGTGTLIKSVIWALVLSLIITALLTAVLSAMVIIGKVQEDSIRAMGTGVAFIGALISVFTISKIHGGKAMIIALIFSALTIIAIAILNVAISDLSIVAGTFPYTASSVLLGSVLGALLTLKRKKRRSRAR
jgi:putative membrane protein (TIGR04086 family)